MILYNPSLMSNLLLAIGGYNGWQPGQTVGSVRSAAVCTQQQNLDYLFQCVQAGRSRNVTRLNISVTRFTNGWIQGIDGHSMGQYCQSHFLSCCLP